MAVRGDREPMVTGEEARKAVELIVAVYESARTGVGVAPIASFAREVQWSEPMSAATYHHSERR